MSCAWRFFFLSIFIVNVLDAQENSVGEKRLFSLAMETNIREYNHKAEIAFYNQDLERVEALFDSIVENVVIGSYLDNFTVYQYKRKKIKLHKFEKPIFLITYSDWYPFAPGEIAALNQIAAKHYREIDFLVLFFDPKKLVKPFSKQFGNRIHLLYVDERSNKFDRIIKSMKHSFGVPTVFFIDGNKKFVDVGRMPAHHFHEEFEASFNSKYNYFLQGISALKNQKGGPVIARKDKDKGDESN